MSIFTVAGWLAAVSFAALTVSGLARMARTRGRWRDARRWHAPLIFASATAVALTVAGACGILTGVILAVLPLAVTAIRVAPAWRLLAERDGWRAATGRILAGLGRRVLDELRDAFRDIRVLLTRGEGEPAAAAAAPPPAPAPAASPRTIPAAVSVRADPVLGDAPSPGEVAGALIMGGVPVPPQWAALCEAVGSFEPDTDEDLINHVAGEAAGILAYADAVRNRAETLMHATGLDPAYVAGHYEFADEFADLAAIAALVNKRFHAIYAAIRDWVSGGGILPHNARQWFAPDGDAAARDEDEAA